MRSRRGLQFVWGLLGAVALVAGSAAVIVGPTIVPGVEDPSANLDSEWRFFATWYAVAGVVLLSTVGRVESASLVIRVAGGAFFVAGSSRVLSIVVEGSPDTTFVVLMVVELTLGPILVPWQAAVERRSVRG